MEKSTASQTDEPDPGLRPEFKVTLQRHGGTPIYLQICARFKAAIAAGRLPPGQRVPSVRSLASELGISRGTATLAYQILAEEGYFTFCGSAGTFIDARHAVRRKAMPSPGAVRRQGANVSGEGIRDLQLGLPALDVFPRKVWNRLVGRRSRGLTADRLGYPDPAGYRPLRETIAAYLAISRGIACGPEKVFVTGGYRASLNLVLSALAGPDDACWFEDPGFPAARDFLTSAGIGLRAVPVDQDGLVVDVGRQIAPDARFSLVTPANQSPLGVMMSKERRRQLLDWARDGGNWIVEDDYDSEYRYNRRPPASLRSMDGDGRVLYAGSFSIDGAAYDAEWPGRAAGSMW